MQLTLLQPNLDYLLDDGESDSVGLLLPLMI